MNILKKISIIIMLVITNFNLSFAVGNTYIRDNLTSTNDEPIIDGVDVINNDGLSILDKIFNYFQDSISGLIFIIALGVFIYIGINLVIARGNPEDFKKYILQFVYAAIGFFVVSAAWAIVKLVAGLNIS